MTIKEIASLAGVSISTVSKIVNNKDQNINPETRSRVLHTLRHGKKYIQCEALSAGRSAAHCLTDQPDAERHPAGRPGTRI